MTYQRVKGTEDFYPRDFALRKAVYDVLADTARKFGFQQVDMPAMETVKLLTAKSGEEVKQQIFVFEKRGAEELGLRFDLTVPMTRMFMSKQRELQKPVKWFAVEPMWRYEAPQKGRQREFVQLSCELFGSDKPEADATCINLIFACMRRLGIQTNDVVLKINNRKLLEGLLLDIAPKEKLQDVIHVIDKVAKLTDEEFIQELKKCEVKNIGMVRKIIEYKGSPEVLHRLRNDLKLNELAAKGLEELEGTLAFVDPSSILVDLSIARGLAYYTGNVYELFDREGKYRALAGGGRYDELVQLFGGEATPATGFAIGAETLMLVLQEKGLLAEVNIGPDYYVAPVDEKVIPRAMEIAQQLRKNFSVDIDLLRRKLGKQLEFASSIGARKVVIVGEKDLREGKVTVRELASGKEERVPVDKL
ncbi:histidine--tRNA ligase [Candidatus Woesearchaeota archaeon]|nr:histidine--tRNA ligase [Candidatus Woesearchaeota archaeon]